MKGFQFAGIASGIKSNGSKDLGIIFCETDAHAAAVFTKNKVKAAPVILGQETIQGGICRAVLVNSGNANCFTGEKGLEDARQCCKWVGDAFNVPRDRVMVSSTGVIGAPLPMDKFEAGIPQLKKALDPDNPDDFATAILTTDTCAKIVSNRVEIDGTCLSMVGVAKGAGMIRPDMATMLAYVLTDAQIAPTDLKFALTKAVAKTFNRITVDGDTSTNDTLMCLASGAGTAVADTPESLGLFQGLLDDTCRQLSRLLVKDGEGATKLVEFVVKGAQTREDAFKVAEAVAHSPLVKTAIYGQDPNWGRITAAAGRCGACVAPEKMDLYFEDRALVRQGLWLGPEAEKKAARIMRSDEILITLDLNLGEYSDFFVFCDFSENYVKINADYRS